MYTSLKTVSCGLLFFRENANLAGKSEAITVVVVVVAVVVEAGA